MPVIIDGNNLLHSLPRHAQDRSWVRQQALDAVRDHAMRLTVVFDGPPPDGSPEVENLGRVTVRYAGPSSADDVIVSLIPQGGQAAHWTIVTDDRTLRDRARERGAQARTLAEWRSRRSRRPRRPQHEAKLSASEIAAWEAYFSTGKDGEDPER